MSTERSFEAWEEVQRHGQDLADRLAQGFNGLIHSHDSNPNKQPLYQWIDRSKQDCEDFKSNVPGNTSTFRKRYLDVQQACDETSLIAYRMIGQIFKGHEDIEELDLNESQLSYLNGGNLSSVDFQDTILNEDLTKPTDDVDTSIKAVQELIPSFTHKYECRCIGSIVDGPTGLYQTYRYVGRGISREWETQTENLRGIRTLVQIENEGDVQDLAEQGRYHTFTNIYIVYTHQMGGNGNVDDPSSSVGSN